ncbi:hypothetical protein BY458DRAFT_458586 [Sporodiniella umbellata]|nr:hypothetical protein BY458DRAFT_458586 [Sporodiniella umbellata]
MYQVKIQLENDTLLITGKPEESVGCVLRGYVELIVTETVKVKSIQMDLLGKLKIHWNERHHPQHTKREYTLIEHHWAFLAPKRHHTLTPNTYLYPFELAIPGHLAGSFDSHSFGSLSYKLKVTIERPTLIPNTHHRRLFWIHRQWPKQPDGETIKLTNAWNDRIGYNVTLPNRVYKRGQDIPIHYELLPGPDTHLRHVSCFLKEYLAIPDHREARIVQFFRAHEPTAQRSLKVPSSPSVVQNDCHHPLIRIQHKLKFNVSFLHHGQLLEVRASIPIEIRTEADDLPTYENVWQTSPYSSPITPLDGVAMDYFSIPLPAYEA